MKKEIREALWEHLVKENNIKIEEETKNIIAELDAGEISGEEAVKRFIQEKHNKEERK